MSLCAGMGCQSSSSSDSNHMRLGTERPRPHRQSELYSLSDSGASGRSKDLEEARELTSSSVQGAFMASDIRFPEGQVPG